MNGSLFVTPFHKEARALLESAGFVDAGIHVPFGEGLSYNYPGALGPEGTLKMCQYHMDDPADAIIEYYNRLKLESSTLHRWNSLLNRAGVFHIGNRKETLYDKIDLANRSLLARKDEFNQAMWEEIEKLKETNGKSM